MVSWISWFFYNTFIALLVSVVQDMTSLTITVLFVSVVIWLGLYLILMFNPIYRLKLFKEAVAENPSRHLILSKNQ